MACPHVESCALYPQFSLDALLRYWKSSYCQADHARCARFRLSSAGEPVPVTLLPSGRHISAAALPADPTRSGGKCG